MNNCKRCRSYAINPGHYGREADVDLDLCDVCYWRKRAETPATTYGIDWGKDGDKACVSTIETLRRAKDLPAKEKK